MLINTLLDVGYVEEVNGRSAEVKDRSDTTSTSFLVLDVDKLISTLTNIAPL